MAKDNKQAHDCNAPILGTPLAARCRHPEKIIKRDSGRLPHWEFEGSTYFITFRLDDSLPKNVLAEISAERERLLRVNKKKNGNISADEQRRIAELFSSRIDEFLDNGIGLCYLADARIAVMMKRALLYFDTEHYDLLAWCIMPNHVHLLLTPHRGWSLLKIMHSLKSYTGQRANRILGKKGPFWQKEYYDHIVRDEDELWRLVEYVIGNPVRSGLENWEWVGRKT